MLDQDPSQVADLKLPADHHSPPSIRHTTLLHVRPSAPLHPANPRTKEVARIIKEYITKQLKVAADNGADDMRSAA
ncbi:MAG: hypothetical protein HYX38_30790 [Rhodospirillales bacterium]|nr:hypothetical protein [Rhodospirillales bacterium]